VSAIAALAFAAGAIFLAQRAGMLSLSHDGSGAEGGDEEADGVGFLDSIANAATNMALNPTSLSARGLELIKRFEGFSATAYSDFKGYSIGYGHLMRAGENLSNISEEEASELLAGDVAWAERAVAAAVAVPITQNQFDALVSLAFNIGEGAFKRSTLVRLLNDGDYIGAAEQFDRWNKAGGQVNRALVQRRATERALFSGGVTV